MVVETDSQLVTAVDTGPAMPVTTPESWNWWSRVKRTLVRGVVTQKEDHFPKGTYGGIRIWDLCGDAGRTLIAKSQPGRPRKDHLPQVG